MVCCGYVELCCCADDVSSPQADGVLNQAVDVVLGPIDMQLCSIDTAIKLN